MYRSKHRGSRLILGIAGLVVVGLAPVALATPAMAASTHKVNVVSASDATGFTGTVDGAKGRQGGFVETVSGSYSCTTSGVLNANGAKGNNDYNTSTVFIKHQQNVLKASNVGGTIVINGVAKPVRYYVTSGKLSLQTGSTAETFTLNFGNEPVDATFTWSPPHGVNSAGLGGSNNWSCTPNGSSSD